MRYILLTLLCFNFVCSLAQNCSLISGTKDKKTGEETFGGITNSKDFYSLLVHKKINRSEQHVSPEYTLSLTAASRVILSDSMLQTKATFDLLLLDSSTLRVTDVSLFNNPIGGCCSLGFQAKLQEEDVKRLAKSPIVTLTVDEIMLTTTFAPKKQKQQQTICECLLIKQ